MVALNPRSLKARVNHKVVSNEVEIELRSTVACIINSFVFMKMGLIWRRNIDHNDTQPNATHLNDNVPEWHLKQ
jgi:hypothetical protein